MCSVSVSFGVEDLGGSLMSSFFSLQVPASTSFMVLVYRSEGVILPSEEMALTSWQKRHFLIRHLHSILPSFISDTEIEKASETLWCSVFAGLGGVAGSGAAEGATSGGGGGQAGVAGGEVAGEATSGGVAGWMTVVGARVPALVVIIGFKLSLATFFLKNLFIFTCTVWPDP